MLAGPFTVVAPDLRAKFPYLINCALNDKNDLVGHEAMEALGLMPSRGCNEMLRKTLEDPNDAVRQNAVFVLKRFITLTNRGDHKVGAIP